VGLNIPVFEMFTLFSGIFAGLPDPFSRSRQFPADPTKKPLSQGAFSYDYYQQ
jgi:hypothetical protein